MDYIEVRTETTHDAAELLAELLAEITGMDRDRALMMASFLGRSWCSSL